VKFLLDQDVYSVTARFLRGLEHDVLPVARIGLAQADEAELLQVAAQEGRLLVARDRDFGGLVFVNALGAGVIYPRMLPSTQDAVHAELARVLASHSEDDLNHAFVVVEPDGYRLRKLPR
jgi:predicted nuclease of predicted toxin-antitoxin system